jgi:hypothetical protein
VKQYRRTTISARKPLLTQWDIYHVHSLDHVLEMTDQQEVVLLKKDESSTLVEYEDTAHTIKKRTQMQLINSMLADAGELLAPESLKALAGKVDHRQRFLQRRFTYGDVELKSGGRLWGGFWQTMPKAQRPHVLRIRGERTVELDFACVMLALAYIYAGAIPPQGAFPGDGGDLYTIPGIDPESRPGVKKLLSAMWFDQKPNRTRFPKDAVKELFTLKDQGQGVVRLIQRIKEHHAGVAHLFGTSIGHTLQFMESELLVNVLLRLREVGIIGLPIHDCVIVQQSKVEKAQAHMEEMSYRVFGREIPVRIG